MSERRRGSPFFMFLAVILLVAPIVGVAWWLNRPMPDTLGPIPPEEMDVVCTGRVDVIDQVGALETSQAGRVVSISVREGERVEKDQEILRLDESIANIRLMQATATVDAAKVDLEVARKDELRLPKQLEAREAMVNAASARLEAARKMIEQRKNQKAVTPLTQAEIEGMDAQLLELVELEKAERTQFDEMKKYIDPKLRIRAAEARLKAAISDQDLAKKAVAECVLRAPQVGQILRIQASVGGFISPGSYPPAVVFAPEGPFVVRAEVDQEFLGRIQEGLAAEIQDDNRPDAPVYKGQVKRISGWVAQRRTFILDPGEINDVRTVECLIELEATGLPLYIGQRMRVRIFRANKDQP